MLAGTSTDTIRISIDSLRAAGVKYIFGVPGAKIDPVFNAFLDYPELRVIVCRHEQNATFIAAAIGKISGKPGVCVVTSGPGTSNLVTGLATANNENMPLVAIAGSVKRSQAAKRTHQSLQTADLLAPVTKKVLSAIVPDQVAEIMLDAFRVAITHPQGATALTLPVDIMTGGVSSTIPAFPASAFQGPSYGPSSDEDLDKAVGLIQAANFPLLYLGSRAATPTVVEQTRAFLYKFPLPVVETYQAAGTVPKELAHLSFGRIGLFRNQPGDELLSNADLVIVAGYDQAEYDADVWNPNNELQIIHVDFTPADIVYNYTPKLELIGSISHNFAALKDRLTRVASPQDSDVAKSIRSKVVSWQSSPEAHVNLSGGPVHPLHFIRLLRSMIDSDTVLCCDIGSVYIYFSRYFASYQPRTFLVSNAQQTLGVALPWAIGASFSQEPPCSRKVVSISGDGGFLFSGQELATAVQQGCDITHFIWNDDKYNMVEFQQMDKYGRSAGVDLGGVDFVKFAHAFDAGGLRVESSAEMESVMEQALAYKGVCVVDVKIDYSQNQDLLACVL